MKLSQKLADFKAEVDEAVPYITANATALKVTTQQVTDEGNFLTDFDNKYAIYADADTHTTQAVIDINNAYNTFHHYQNGIKQQIKNNKAVTLTGQAITKIHLHVDDPRRHHVLPPAFAPDNEVIKTSHLVNKIFTSNPTPGKETETNLPVDVFKIGRKLAVIVGDDVPTAAQYQHLAEIGATVYDIFFAPQQAVTGAKAWLITWYVNARGEEGPESTPYPFPII